MKTKLSQVEKKGGAQKKARVFVSRHIGTGSAGGKGARSWSGQLVLTDGRAMGGKKTAMEERSRT